MGLSNQKHSLKSILIGWLNLIFNRDEVLANKRLHHCLNCEFMEQDITKTCSLCGCPIKAKVRSKYEKCPYPDNPKW